MRLLSALLASLLLLAQPVFAQEPADRLMPESSPAPDVPLIPEEVPQNTKPRGGAAAGATGTTFQKSKTDVNIELQRERIRFREAKIKALRDSQVQAEWQRAEAARTDYEKREALKRYYTLLYARMTKLDKSIKTLIHQHQLGSLRRLEQTRIDPTQPFLDGE